VVAVAAPAGKRRSVPGLTSITSTGSGSSKGSMSTKGSVKAGDISLPSNTLSSKPAAAEKRPQNGSVLLSLSAESQGKVAEACTVQLQQRTEFLQARIDEVQECKGIVQLLVESYTYAFKHQLQEEDLLLRRAVLSREVRPMPRSHSYTQTLIHSYTYTYTYLHIHFLYTPPAYPYYALCTMHYALCTMHYALCTMHYALCTMHQPALLSTAEVCYVLCAGI
jgi:hypothetical protein